MVLRWTWPISEHWDARTECMASKGSVFTIALSFLFFHFSPTLLKNNLNIWSVHCSPLMTLLPGSPWAVTPHRVYFCHIWDEGWVLERTHNPHMHTFSLTHSHLYTQECHIEVLISLAKDKTVYQRWDSHGMENVVRVSPHTFVWTQHPRRHIAASVSPVFLRSCQIWITQFSFIL